jgi:tetratricopeptide (TPR) repeat protein
MATEFARRVACGLILVTGLFGCGGVAPVKDPFNKGVAHYSQGRYAQAIAEYRLALEDNPSDLRARFNLASTLETEADRLENEASREASVLVAQGQASVATETRARAESSAVPLRTEALSIYESILAVDPQNVRASVNVAAREYERGETEASLSRLQALVKDNPNALLARTSLAQLLRNEKRREAALLELEAARSIDPTDVDVCFSLGQVWEELGDPALARRAYEQGLSRESEDLGTILALGRLERQHDRLRESRSWFQRALYIAPRLWEAHWQLAELSEGEGLLRESVQHWWDAEELDAERPVKVARPDYRGRLAALYRRLADEAVSGSASP